MKPQVRIYFSDVWKQLTIDDNFFIDIIKEDFDVIITNKNPDFIFYSVFGLNYLKYNCPRIFYTGENIRPDFRECDWAFSFDFSDNLRNYRLPLYTLFGDVNELLKPRDTEKLFIEKTNFCAFIYSNPGAKKRNQIFHELSKYKRVDSAGPYMNNMRAILGGYQDKKRDFIKKYKFAFAFENSLYPGYTTEKIFDCLLAGCVPLYWGNPLVYKDFNPKCLINYHDYEDDESFIRRVIEVDNNDDLYKEYLSQPSFSDNKVNEYVDRNNIRNQLYKIFTTKIEPVSQKSFSASTNPIIRKINYLNKYLLYCFRNYQKRIRNISLDRLKVKYHRIIERY